MTVRLDARTDLRLLEPPPRLNDEVSVAPCAAHWRRATVDEMRTAIYTRPMAERLRQSAPDGVGTSARSSSKEPCIFVIGMHRSGTSATTGTLAALGMGAPQDGDRLNAGPFNERGLFESKTLIRLNDQILAAVGGSWSAPPSLKPAWEADPALEGLRRQARADFAATFPTRPSACKDPRLCVTLPFWRTVVEPPQAAVFVYRDPLEVARSLRARNGFGIIYGLALWDRYVRSACVNLSGIPTIATSFSKTLDRPAAWTDALADFLGSVDATVDPAKHQAAIDSLDAGLRHQRTPTERTSGIWNSQIELFDTLRQLEGIHRPWSVPDIGPEPEWVDDVLDLRRGGEMFWRMQRLMKKSRSFRFTQRAWRFAHGGKPTAFDSLVAERRAQHKDRLRLRDTDT